MRPPQKPWKRLPRVNSHDVLSSGFCRQKRSFRSRPGRVVLRGWWTLNMLKHGAYKKRTSATVERANFALEVCEDVEEKRNGRVSGERPGAVICTQWQGHWGRPGPSSGHFHDRKKQDNWLGPTHWNKRVPSWISNARATLLSPLNKTILGTIIMIFTVISMNTLPPVSLYGGAVV